MKLRDAERCAKATEVFLERMKGLHAKIEVAEKRALAAVEALSVANKEISSAYARWNALMEEIDPDSDLESSIDEDQVTLKLDDLTEAIEGAFEQQGEQIDEAVELFESVLERAQDYEEEPEEEDDEDEEEGWVFTCDHPGCKAEIDADSKAQAEAAARKSGWDIEDDRQCFCPKHLPE